MTTSPAVSEHAIAELRSLNPEDPQFLRELIDLFLQDMPARFADLETAIEKNDAALLTRAAHTIKGSCGNFGASDLAAVALTMEHQGKTGAFAEAKASYPLLKAEFARVDAALRALT
jgi:HPt (histidine-containing phosphotransfer) domain-containing protein